MKLLRLTIDNFKGLRHFEARLDGRNATIYGDNATGKTTLYDAFLWLLFGKDSLGRKDFEILPLGLDGKPANRGVETAVEADLEILPGASVTLRRVYAEKWEKRRGSACAELTGHTTAYCVDGLPVKQGDYKAYVEQLCPEKTFQALTGPEYFCQTLPWQERRKTLFELAGGVSEAEIFAENPELAELGKAKGAHSVEDFKRIQERRRAALNKELEGLPGRVDEASRAIVSLDSDPAQAQAEAERLRQERKALEGAMARGRDGMAEAITAAAAEKRAEIAELESHNAQARARRREDQAERIRQACEPIQARLRDCSARLAQAQGALSAARVEAKAAAAHCERLRTAYAEEAGRAWDGDLACPACKRPYAPEDVQEAQAAFARRMEARLEEIAAEGEAERQRAAQAQAEAEALAAEVKERECERSALEDELLDAEAAENAGGDDCDGYVEGIKALHAELAALVNRAQEAQAGTREAEREARARVAALDARIAACESCIARAEGNARAQARVAELLDRQKAVGAELEAAERMILLCEQYARAMVRLTEARVDGRFRLVRWKLFDEQINGGLADTCTPTVEGVPYPDLNHAMRINAGLDVVRALAAHYGFTAPVFVDNAESVTALMRIPAQTIRLVVSEEDQQLRVQLD